MPVIETLERPAAVLRGRRLEYFTVVWNTLEGLIASLPELLQEAFRSWDFGWIASSK